MLGVISDQYFTEANIGWLFICVAFLIVGWLVLELLSAMLGPTKWDGDEDYYE